MSEHVFRVEKPAEYRKAGPDDLIRLLPAPGVNPLFLNKWLLEALVYSVVSREFVHLSGPTGSAKSSLLEALHLNQTNFAALCSAMGFAILPLKLYPIEMATYETPGELYQRRSLKGGSTFDEKSRLVEALQDASTCERSFYPLVWLREVGRVHSASVQGGLLNLMTKSDIVLPDGQRIQGQDIAWVADSNYQAESDSTHTLVTLDDALKRRFSINLTLTYLSPEQEIQVLRHVLLDDHRTRKGGVPAECVVQVVHLGNVIRRQRSDGNLQSVAPPTIWGYLAFLRMAVALPHLSLQQIARLTLLGNASTGDTKMVTAVLNEVFALQEEGDQEMASNLF